MPRVLVVEDDRPIRNLLVSALGRAGLDAAGAEDGAQALEIVADGGFAVILVDLMMPRMDGFTFTATLAAMPLPVRPIVMVMTAFTELPPNRLDPYAVHAYFRKPFDVQVIVDVIREVATEIAAGGAPLPGGLAAPIRPTGAC